MNAFVAALDDTHVYPITDTRLSGWSHAQQVELLCDAGARVIQVRDKSLSSFEFYREAAAAMKVARARDAKIIINDRVDIAIAVAADGVHLGQDDLPPVVARRLLGPRSIIGYSTHNIEQAEAATRLEVDYVAIGPVFTTESKEAPDPVIGLPIVTAVRKVLSFTPLVAIGGITFKNAHSVITAGADVVAVIADLWPFSGGNPKSLNAYV